MISQKEFIEASKRFVCVRLETYESKETQDRIRDLLHGSMQNTAFVVYAPDGKQKLTRSARSPEQVFGRRGPHSSVAEVVDGMEKIASRYQPKELGDAVLQDFDSFKQSLNVASADQRLLVFAAVPRAKNVAVRKTLRAAFNDPDLSGKFHFDVAEKVDAKWAKSVKGVMSKAGVFIIQSDTYGQSGTVLESLPVDVSEERLKEALRKCNAEFAAKEQRKNYAKHVREGRRDGVEFRNNIEQGEDWDGDGKIDTKRDHKGPPPRFGPPPHFGPPRGDW